MLGAAGNVNLGVPDETRQRAANEGTRMPGRGNIRIVDRQRLEIAACECYRHIKEVIGSFRAA